MFLEPTHASLWDHNPERQPAPRTKGFTGRIPRLRFEHDIQAIYTYTREYMSLSHDSLQVTLTTEPSEIKTARLQSSLLLFLPALRGMLLALLR
jgi:hypothetical protein